MLTMAMSVFLYNRKIKNKPEFLAKKIKNAKPSYHAKPGNLV
jgi:hypothetical protein